MPKTILITGSSSGIGKATAELFVKKKWNVVATMRSPEKEQNLAGGDKLILIKMDVTDEISVKEAVEKAIAHFGKIDVIVNNAGYGLLGPFEAATKEQIERQFATNVFGVMNVTRAILPHFRKNKKGTIVNVTSMGGRVTFPFYSIYHGTKWAIEGFTESLQYELQDLGIRVKLIEPGVIKTDFYGRSRDMISSKDLTAYDHYMSKVIPKMQKEGDNAPKPEIVAKVIHQAATDTSGRLRYQANSEAILILRRILPEDLYCQIIRAILQ
jgi:NAD(P)-dependent dehydrogenase (short-subunit alcohol dehydrogenase family)